MGLDDALGLAVRGRDDVFVWGFRVLRHFDGNTWTTIRTLTDAGTRPEFREHAVSVQPGQVWAGDDRGGVESWNGTTWTPSDTLGTGFNTVLATENAVFVGGTYEGASILRKARP